MYYTISGTSKREFMDDVAECIAVHFGFELERDEKGRIITSGYDWEAGCYCGSTWMSPRAFLWAMDDFCDDLICFEDEDDEDDE